MGGGAPSALLSPLWDTVVVSVCLIEHDRYSCTVWDLWPGQKGGGRASWPHSLGGVISDSCPEVGLPRRGTGQRFIPKMGLTVLQVPFLPALLVPWDLCSPHGCLSKLCHFRAPSHARVGEAHHLHLCLAGTGLLSRAPSILDQPLPVHHGLCAPARTRRCRDHGDVSAPICSSGGGALCCPDCLGGHRSISVARLPSLSARAWLTPGVPMGRLSPRLSSVPG